MKKWILVPTLAAILATTGCSSTDESAENAATMNRDQAIATLSEQIAEVGYNPVAIQPGVDEFLNICASVLKRQHKVMEEYRTQAEHYADVQAFLYAHKDKEPAELQAAIVEFDNGAQSEDEKIAPKILAYQSAIDEVSKQNAELTVEITVQVAQAAYMITQYGQAIAQSTALNMAGSLFSSEEKNADNDLGLAVLRAKDQISLASDANKIISIEQDTIKAIDSLQAELDAKS
ncbi:hypothetical protein OCL06_12375 [Alteromonas sp. ASW11-19]|uniref:Uncharacterized protein n=1 Tax=Alteromonas salexigens TaxID=2982530 RepID=A0ABT2VR61_9ALTE|nr:hypothetical protein [Alteromonas salexigens]MCU7555383.1 hypothetical protein [Alteromonas salexigens]